MLRYCVGYFENYLFETPEYVLKNAMTLVI